MAGCRRKFDLVSQQDDCCSDRFLSELRNLYGNYYFGQFSADHLRGQRGCQVLSKLFQEHQRLSLYQWLESLALHVQCDFAFDLFCGVFVSSLCGTWIIPVEQMESHRSLYGSLRLGWSGSLQCGHTRHAAAEPCQDLDVIWCNLMYLRHVC